MLFALYEQSSNLEEFSDSCQRELVDFFGDSKKLFWFFSIILDTESFVSDLMNHISLSFDVTNLESHPSKVSQHRQKSGDDESVHSDFEGSDDK